MFTMLMMSRKVCRWHSQECQRGGQAVPTGLTTDPHHPVDGPHPPLQPDHPLHGQHGSHHPQSSHQDCLWRTRTLPASKVTSCSFYQLHLIVCALISFLFISLVKKVWHQSCIATLKVTGASWQQKQYVISIKNWNFQQQKTLQEFETALTLQY